MDSKNQTIVGSHSVSEILGVKDVEGADRLQATIAASPAEQCLWSIIGRTVDSVTATTVEINVLITYDCEFFDRQVQTQSLSRDSKKTKPESKEIKTKQEDDEWDDLDNQPVELLRAKAKELQRAVSKAELNEKLETASKKGKQ
jgi:hypothetical protein